MPTKVDLTGARCTLEGTRFGLRRCWQLRAASADYIDLRAVFCPKWTTQAVSFKATSPILGSPAAVRDCPNNDHAVLFRINNRKREIAKEGIVSYCSLRSANVPELHGWYRRHDRVLR
jgi:hypothetical protein